MSRRRENLFVKVYADGNGELLEAFRVESHEEAIRKLDQFPSIVRCARVGKLRVRIEDSSGSGCWLLIGDPPLPDLNEERQQMARDVAEHLRGSEEDARAEFLRAVRGRATK